MKLFIEVGAYDGRDSLYWHKKGYKVFTFEPKKDLYDQLVEKTKNIDNYTVINKAVCSFDGETTFNICKRGGASSMLSFKSDEELIKHWTEERTDIQYSGESYTVQTTRLDTFIEEYNLQNETIDYIHIDAQGVDLDVLKSLGIYIKNLKAGVLETVKEPEKSIYIGQNNNTLSNVQEFLNNTGFRIKNVKNNDKTNCEFNVLFERI